MVVVGEAFLSAFLQVLFDRLASRELLNFARREGLRKKLDKWRKTLKRIQAVLDDADEKQHTDKEVKQWLDDLRDLAYDVEDILDEFVTDDLRRKLTGGNQASTSKARKLISWNPRAFMIKYRLESKIKEIDARFKDLVAQKGELNLGENVGRMSCETKRMLAPTSLVNEAHVYGREKDKEAVLELLLNENCSGAEVSVIPILGMGGMGKTTLAQLIYNDEKVQSSFDLKAWACVSEDFDAVRVTKSILKSTTFASRDDNDLNLLQVELKEKLQGKKFLIVLDDLWNENYNDWTILRAPFEAGAPGSRIVITTRNQEVSSITGTIPAYLLQVLSNDACLSVFTQHALGASDFSAHANLQHIGEEIVKKCKGLPLAAKTLGGLLRTKLDCDEWEDVLKSKIWDIPEERSGIVPALMLSYHHLPSHLKRCFAYCSILPKDYDFEKKQLVLIWMAEGLIQPQENEKQMEDLGSEYFHSLLSRSFFQQSSIRKSRFVMHDLINDLAQWVAGDICFRMEDRFEGINEGKISKKARHSSYLDRNYDDATKKFGVFFELTRLRTFLPLMLPNLLPVKPRKRCYFPNLPQLLPKLRCLRVLSFHGYYITELPDSIGDLKHLRYLDLSYTRIRGLPESTTSLCNLQTLILKECCYLEELPSKLGNLVKLRHLNILNAYRLKGMPPQIGKLTCLQTLPHLFVGNNSCSGVNELGPLLHLRKTLIISRLENAIEPRDARDAKLIEKPNLTTLCLEWSRNIDESQDRTIEAEVLNMLQPHKALKELTIMSYGGIEFPTWLRGHSFPDMVLLRIENCKNCTSLPPIGQLPSLKYLFIEGMASVKNVGVEFYGESCSQPFRSLETLCFENMKEWDSWSPCGEFPNLRKLSIQYCPKLLGKLPNHLPSLKKVLISGCQWLVVSISSFPELCELEIEGSKGVVHRNKVDFSSLNSKSLSTISEFRCPIEGFILDVEDLALGNCEELMALWSNDVRLLQTLPCLRVLRICNWPKLVSLVAEEVKEQLQLGLPSTLRKIYISHCNGMESLPKAMMYNYTFVEHIEICECDSLTHFATGQLPSTLKGLKISECKNMLILLDEDDTNICSSNTSLLEYLIISDCPSLKSLIPSGELPATLKHLRISSCGELESIAKSFPHNSSLESIWIYDCENLKFLPMGIHTLSHLDKVEIRNCPTLVSFPDGGLLPGNLRVLMISNCEEMRVLPNCIHNITSLQELRIWKCPSIVSFPEEGFPINLTSLEICDCNITEALLEWGLHMLTSLQQLKISGGCPHLVSFPEMLLPASLTTFTIINFPNLKCLSSKGFQELASLKTLRISCCANLVSFLENVLSPSLLDLRIDCCEKLTSFPEDGLPRSLLTLSIWHCPLLKERCKKDQGQEWFKIAHIPCVLIDGKFIYDPERGK